MINKGIVNLLNWTLRIFNVYLLLYWPCVFFAWLLAHEMRSFVIISWSQVSYSSVLSDQYDNHLFLLLPSQDHFFYFLFWTISIFYFLLSLYISFFPSSYLLLFFILYSPLVQGMEFPNSNQEGISMLDLKLHICNLSQSSLLSQRALLYAVMSRYGRSVIFVSTKGWVISLICGESQFRVCQLVCSWFGRSVSWLVVQKNLYSLLTASRLIGWLVGREICE